MRDGGRDRAACGAGGAPGCGRLDAGGRRGAVLASHRRARLAVRARHGRRAGMAARVSGHPHAAQALIGRLLGAHSIDVAAQLARRLLVAGLALGLAFASLLAAGHSLLPAIFSGDPAVRAQAAHLWPWLVLMMPVNGVLFALDGVLLGAGDLRFMRNVTVAAALLGYLPVSLATAQFGWGLTGIWIGLSAF